MAWGNDRIRDLVTRTIIGEALDTPESMISVAQVLKNRADSGQYGDPLNGGLASTITARNKAGQYQFSMWHPSMASSGKTISPNDPRYQRAAQVADAVFDGKIPDNTGGADHYYAPGGMPGGRAPSWAIGQTPTATIGGQHFYKLGLSAVDATNFGHTSAPAIGTPAPAPAAADSGFVYGGESPQDQGVDIRHLEPVFRARIEKLQADAAAAGIKTHLTDGYRDNKSQAADYAKLGAQGLAAAPGQSYHQFGRAVDLVADNPAQQQALVALADQPGRGITAGAHFATPDRVHFQAAEGKTAPLLEAGVTAPATPAGQGGIGSESRMPLGTAPPGPPAVSTIVPNPDVPAANAQPVSATAPAAPGGGKYSVIQRMTTGTSRNPELITAANWGNLFGGAAPSAPPAAAPAAVSAPSSQPARPDIAQRVPLAQTPLPPPRPTPSAIGAYPDSTSYPQISTPPPAETPTPAPPAPTPAPAAASVAAPDPAHVPNWGPWHSGGSPSGPIIAHPWDRPLDMSQPPPPPPPPQAPVDSWGLPPLPKPGERGPFDPPTAPLSMVPGSMLSSAQNLIKLLFPTA